MKPATTWRSMSGAVLAVAAISSWLWLSPAGAEEKKEKSGPPRVMPAGKLPADERLKPPRTYNDAYHPWAPPATKEAWEQQREAIKQRALVSTGLWPKWPSEPMKPVIHGKIDRDGYTVEKVFFASLPGHYVTGNLYRPKNVKGKAPGVLCPHGHWPNGRFYELSEEKAKSEQINIGAETLMSGARYPLQARMVGLARMGCVVFHYDMVGYADSTKLAHRSGFGDVAAELWLQNYMGLQTWNSIRALDFLTSLPEVDADRIGVTGASGGGTQTFMLCGIDPRPAVAFPAVMVSTAMQGGCVCENCSHLRVGLNNIALAALFAPKPQAMSGADDWTIEIEKKGLPELQQIYSLYEQRGLVNAKTYPQFKHNYNQVAREMMYNWFNQHLQLGQKAPVVEQDFVPVPPAELRVFDSEHPMPADTLGVDALKQQLTKQFAAQYAALLPKDAAGAEKYREVVGAAARVLLDSGVPEIDDVLPVTPLIMEDRESYQLYVASITRKDVYEQIPTVGLVPPNFAGTIVLWVDGKGKSHLFDAAGQPTAAVQKLLKAGYGVASADLFLTGEFLNGDTSAATKVNETFPGYTFGYNRSVLANRVRDILTVIAGIKKNPGVQSVQLVGTGEAGPWALLARGLAGDHITKCIADAQGFSFARIESASNPMMLPGALKYGGLAGLTALAAPAPLTVAGAEGLTDAELQPLTQMYKATGGKLQVLPARLSADDAVAEVLK